MYKHSSGLFLRLYIKRKSGVNTYIVVDEFNAPILKKCPYTGKMKQQKRIVKGFDKLTKI